MRVHISPNDGIPIYQQIVNQVKFLVAARRLKPGDEVLPIRALAEQLLVNPNTVARAYRELESSGVLVSRQGSGTRVADAGSPLSRKEKMRLLRDRADTLLAEAYQLGVSLDDTVELVRERGSVLEGEGGKS